MQSRIDRLFADTTRQDTANLSSRSIWTFGFAGVLLAIAIAHVLLLVVICRSAGPGFEEPGNLVAALSCRATGRFDLSCVNPPLTKLISSLPLDIEALWVDRFYWENPSSRPEFRLGQEFFAWHGMEAQRALVSARLALIPFSLLGGAIVVLWSARLGGRQAAIISIALWAVSPSILVAGSSACSDLALTFFGLCSLLIFRNWLENPSGFRTIGLGISLGLALLSKATAIVYCGLLPFALAFYLLLQSKGASTSRSILHRSFCVGLRLMLAIALALLLLNAVYSFSPGECLRPLGEFDFSSTALRGSGTNCFRDIGLGWLPSPLPHSYLVGIDIQKRDFEIGFRSYLLGEWRERGWTVYYVVVMLVKVPFAFWPLVFMGLIEASQWSRSDKIALLGIPTALFFFISLQDGFNHHGRYVLPCLPPLIIAAGQAVYRLGKVRTSLLVVIFSVDSLSQAPHMDSFFTGAIGGPVVGRHVLAHSNLDQGRDLLAVAEWRANTVPENDPFFYGYAGSIDPSNLGLSFDLPHSPASPGWYAISGSLLMGQHNSVPTGNGFWVYVTDDRFVQFQGRNPLLRIGGTFIYRVPP